MLYLRYEVTLDFDTATDGLVTIRESVVIEVAHGGSHEGQAIEAAKAQVRKRRPDLIDAPCLVLDAQFLAARP